MHKQVTAMLCSILAVFFCCAGAPDYDNTTEPDYVQDGLEKYVSESEMAEEVSDVREQLDPFVTYTDGTLSFHIEEAQNATSFADEVYTGVRFNVELMNQLADPEMRAAYISHKKSLFILLMMNIRKNGSTGKSVFIGGESLIS